MGGGTLSTLSTHLISIFPSKAMPRTISLSVFDNGARPAHWAIFIPTGDVGQKGKIIHVTGNPATCFFLEFKRNYDYRSELRTYQIIPLGQVSDQSVRDTVGNGQESMILSLGIGFSRSPRLCRRLDAVRILLIQRYTNYLAPWHAQ